MNISGTGFVAAEILIYLLATAVVAFLSGWLTSRLFAAETDENLKNTFEGARKELISVNAMLSREREAHAATRKELETLRTGKPADPKKKAAAQ